MTLQWQKTVDKIEESANCPNCGSGNISRDFEYGNNQQMTSGVDTTAICRSCGVKVSEYFDGTVDEPPRATSDPSDESDSESIGYGPNWESIRKVVYARDGWNCRRCGESNCEIHAHHITPLRNFIQDGIVNYDEANDMDNLVTLCQECHCMVEGNYQDLTYSEFIKRVGV